MNFDIVAGIFKQKFQNRKKAEDQFLKLIFLF